MGPVFDGGSFKDPSGRVFTWAGLLYRSVDADTLATLARFYDDPVAGRLAGRLVETAIEPAPEGTGLTGHVLRHRWVRPVTYCYEWTPSQLRDAARLTLELQIELLNAGYTLKDATPFNVLFDGARPVFIDLPSIREWRGDGAWIAFSECLENFVYPLMATAYLGLPAHELTLATLGKVPTAQAARLFSRVPFWRRGVLRYVRAPELVRRSALRHRSLESVTRTAEVPRRVIVGNCERLLEFVNGLDLRCAPTHWHRYTDTQSYTDDDREQKAEFVRRALGSARPRADPPATGLDVGANTGQYTRLLADAGLTAVAVEADVECAEQIYHWARGEGRAVVPVVMDFARPTPALGWAGAERRSFTDRFADSTVLLALAVVHHLRYTANVPLAMILDQMRRLAGCAVIEWVPPGDPMARALVSGKDDTYHDYTEASFRTLLAERYDVVEERRLSQGRLLFSLTRR